MVTARELAVPMFGSYLPEAPLFCSGSIHVTPAAQQVLNDEDLRIAFHRHFNGDWGELDDEAKEANDEAWLHARRITSEYVSGAGLSFWITTDGKRARTIVLLVD